ncbi:hypothetical protein V2J09_011303 [Rumex salicifolius]
MAAFPCRSLSISLAVLVLSSLLHMQSAVSVLPTIHHPIKTDMSFLVIGDWGRRGGFNQSQVASQMGRIGEELGIEFVVSTGDNFYENGLTGEQDAAFHHSFTDVYTAPSLNIPWYTVLGNHDYRGDAEAQLSDYLRKVDPRWVCRRSFIVHAEIAEIFMVDTTPFVNMYFTDAKDHSYDWRGILPSRTAYLNTLLNELESALQQSTAKWKIVVGHHAIRSIGHHGDTLELLHRLLPILQSNDVDFYVNGHDHCLEQISDTNSPMEFLTSGAGSKAWRGDTKSFNRNDVKFFYDGQGFMSMKMNPSDVHIAFYDVNGQVLHNWTTTKHLPLSSS